jgi:hypothetical protein
MTSKARLLQLLAACAILSATVPMTACSDGSSRDNGTYAPAPATVNQPPSPVPNHPPANGS